MFGYIRDVWVHKRRKLSLVCPLSTQTYLMYPNLPYVPKRLVCTQTSLIYPNVPYVYKCPLCTQMSLMYPMSLIYQNVPYVPKKFGWMYFFRI